MTGYGGFENPFISIFQNGSPASDTKKSKAGDGSGTNFSYENHFQQNYDSGFRSNFDNNFEYDFQGRGVANNTEKVDSSKQFHNEFQNQLSHATSKEVKETYVSKHNSYPPGFFKTLDNGTQAPQFLILRKRGLLDTELYDPVTDQVIYRTYNTGRSPLSTKPDVEIFRVSDRDSLIGTIRLGAMTDKIKCLSTGRRWDGIEKFSSPEWLLQGDTPRTLNWTTTQYGRNNKETSSSEHSTEEAWTEDILIQELCDPSQPYGIPVCLSRLHSTSPLGRLEIWADGIRTTDPVIRWSLFDEIVLSAYAKLEKSRRNLIKDGVKDGVKVGTQAVEGGFAGSGMNLPPLFSVVTG